jgi:alcohol dehydrogenase
MKELKSMKAVRFDEHGGVDKLVHGDWPDPEPRPGDAIVRVRAVGLNYLDVLARQGMPGVKIPLPFISGGDIAGEVESLGVATLGWNPGDRVVVNPKTPEGLIGEEVPGGLAEKVRVPVSHLVRLPDGLDFTTAAAVPINYGTALRMLITIGGLKAGEKILILGASGGVGTACVQIARMIGAEILAAAGSAEKAKRLTDMGADYVIDYGTEDFSRRAWEITGKKGVDVVVNFTGGDTFIPSIRAMARYGRMLVCGATAGFDPKIDLRYVWRRELQIIGSTGYTQDDIAEALRLVAEGKLAPVISHTFPLAETAAAEALIEERSFFGKIIVFP